MCQSMVRQVTILGEHFLKLPCRSWCGSLRVGSLGKCCWKIALDNKNNEHHGEAARRLWVDGIENILEEISLRGAVGPGPSMGHLMRI